MTPAPSSEAHPPGRAVLRTRVDVVVPATRQAAEAAYEHPRLRERYAALLGLHHAIALASVPLLRTAEHEATRRAAAGDDVARGLIEFVHRRATAALHHDDWLLEDFASLDRDPAEVLRRPPPPAVAALAGASYYWILHFHPVAVLGHVAILDAAPPSPALVAGLPERTGHPSSAFRTLAHDADTGPGRCDELWALVDRLPLTDVLADLVVTVAVHTGERYVAALGGLTR